MTTLNADLATTMNRVQALLQADAKRHRGANLGAARVFKRALRVSQLQDQQWLAMLYHLVEMTSGGAASKKRNTPSSH